ncbi:hypothetical protein [Dyella choica]|nr:hypothetical protein [Dyella choica]
MRRYVLLALLITTCSARALQSIRVGSQLLVVGDSTARVKELLGQPSVRASSSSGQCKARKAVSGASGRGKQRKAGCQQWQYRRDGHTTTFFIVDGKIARIDDVAR